MNSKPAIVISLLFFTRRSKQNSRNISGTLTFSERTAAASSEVDPDTEPSIEKEADVPAGLRRLWAAVRTGKRLSIPSAGVETGGVCVAQRGGGALTCVHTFRSLELCEGDGVSVFGRDGLIRDGLYRTADHIPSGERQIPNSCSQ